MKLTNLALVGAALAVAACSDTTPTQPLSQAQAASPTYLRLDNGDLVHVLPLATSKSDFTANAGVQAGILYHGGRTLIAPKVTAIYWSTKKLYVGGPTPGTKGTGAQDLSVVGHFLRNLGGSPYYNINTTYWDAVGAGHTVTNTLTYSQVWSDKTGVPSTTGSPVSNGAIRNEIIKGFNTGKITFNANTIYAVFTGGKTNLGGGFGTQYCAYHGKFNWNGKVIVYAAMPFVQAFPSACSTGQPSPNGDLAADRVANVLGHEIEEAVTDPDLNAWFDASGQENADKCAWTFGTTYTTGNGGVANMNLGGKDFLIQRNWLNVLPNGNCAQSF